MSTQEFRESVGQVIQTESVTQIHHDHGRLLTSVERIELNDLVKQLEEFGEPGWKTWRFLHRTIGVENIEAMCLDHRDNARAILDLLLERAELKQQLSLSATTSQEGAASQATLLLQNSDLSGKLKEALKSLKLYEARQAEAKAVIQRLMTDRETTAENLHKAKRLADGLSEKNCRLQDAEQRARKRGNRMMLATAASFLMMTGSVAGMVFFFQKAEAAASTCELNGAAYPVGSVMLGKTEMECTRVDDGWADWRARQKGKKAK